MLYFDPAIAKPAPKNQKIKPFDMKLFKKVLQLLIQNQKKLRPPKTVIEPPIV